MQMGARSVGSAGRVEVGVYMEVRAKFVRRDRERPLTMKKRMTIAALVVFALGSVFTAEALSRPSVRLAPESTKTIRGDVLWMRVVTDSGSPRELLAPFAIDFRGRWCWAPASVFEESCTVTVSRRQKGRRTLINGSRVSVRVTYTRRF